MRSANCLAVTFPFTAPGRRYWLAGLACALLAIPSAHAVSRFQFPSGNKKPQSLKAERSIKGQKLPPYRATQAPSDRKGPKEEPAYYLRKQEGYTRLKR